jgi:hypothetical protein
MPNLAELLGYGWRTRLLRQQKALEAEEAERERQGQASALTRMFRADPERARAFGYLRETMPPVERAEHELPEQDVEPVSPAEAPTLGEFLKERLRGEREEARDLRTGQRVLDAIGAKGEEARKTQAERLAAMEDMLEKRIAAAKAAVQHKDDLRMQIEQFREQGRRSRMTVQERGKNIRAFWTALAKPLEKLAADRAELRETIAALQARVNDPDTDEGKRVGYQMRLSALQDALDELETTYREALSIRDEAQRAVQFGPETAPPTDRPGPPKGKPRDPLGIR